jgi:hypothetical protein
MSRKQKLKHFRSDQRGPLKFTADSPPIYRHSAADLPVLMIPRRSLRRLLSLLDAICPPFLSSTAAVGQMNLDEFGFWIWV